MAGPSYYELLGVKPTATTEEITAAYRRLSKAAHPDAGGTGGLFLMLAEAKRTLVNPALRRSYDAELARADAPTPPEPPPRPPTPPQPPRPAPRPQQPRPARRPEPTVPAPPPPAASRPAPSPHGWSIPMPGLVSRHQTVALGAGGATWLVSVVYAGAALTGIVDAHLTAPRPGQALALAIVGGVIGPLVYRHWLAAMQPRRRWAIIAGAWLGLAAMLYVALAAMLAAFAYFVFRVGNQD